MGNQGRVAALPRAVLIKACMLKGVNQSSCVSTAHQPAAGPGASEGAGGFAQEDV